MLTYLDIETTALRPESGQITTIQMRDMSTPNGPLTIKWAEDVGGEKGLIKWFQEKTKFYTNRWSTIPCGFGLAFEFRWLAYKAVRYGVVPFGWNPLWLIDRPNVDLHHLFVMANGADFKGSSLDAFSTKGATGADAARMIAAGDRKGLEQYIQREADSFLDVWNVLKTNLGPLWHQNLWPEVRSLNEIRQKRRPGDIP